MLVGMAFFYNFLPEVRKKVNLLRNSFGGWGSDGLCCKLVWIRLHLLYYNEVHGHNSMTVLPFLLTNQVLVLAMVHYFMNL